DAAGAEIAAASKRRGGGSVFSPAPPRGGARALFDRRFTRDADATPLYKWLMVLSSVQEFCAYIRMIATTASASTSSVTLIQLHGRDPAVLPVTPLTSTWYEVPL